jgi:hypothetical protein
MQREDRRMNAAPSASRAFETDATARLDRLAWCDRVRRAERRKTHAMPGRREFIMIPTVAAAVVADGATA